MPDGSLQSIPKSASQPRLPRIMEASVDPQPRGPDWMPITPKTGSLLHADSHRTLPSLQFAPKFDCKGAVLNCCWCLARVLWAAAIYQCACSTASTVAIPAIIEP